MANLLDRIIQTPLRFLSLLLTIGATAVVIGFFVPALYGFVLTVVLFIIGTVIGTFLHPTLPKFYILAVVVLAIFAVRAGFNPLAERDDDDSGTPILRGRDLLSSDYVRNRAATNLHTHYSASRARRRTL